MGQAKRKRQFVDRNGICVFCGGNATTIDHCPPRVFFDGRHSPRGYEFPACLECNEITRRDEQAIALIVWATSTDDRKTGPAWTKLAREVRNNSPEIYREWHQSASNPFQTATIKFLESKMNNGASLKPGAVCGPLTYDAILRIAIKLAKGIYYYHYKAVFDGSLYVTVFCGTDTFLANDEIENAKMNLPLSSYSSRNSQDLSDQFFYKYITHQSTGYLAANGSLSPQICFGFDAVPRGAKNFLEQNGWIEPNVQPIDCIVGKLPIPEDS